MEPFYPLQVFVCGKCFLVQLQEFVAPKDIFSDYLYFASYSDTWLAHAKRYTEDMVQRFPISENSLVIEIASNDGYLLQYFAEKKVPVLGVEPAANVAQVAAQKGIASVVKFFSSATARELLAEGKAADLLLGNNVLAHVPDINDFVAGMKILLKAHGVITMEFPHLMQLMEQNQFDTIYHEHFSYFSFLTVQAIFAAHGLVLFDVEELPTHGGSLRIFARHAEDSTKPVGPRVIELRAREESAGYARLETYSRFAEQVKETKRKLLEFLIKAKRSGKKIAAYGAAAKGNTLLNYCAIRTDFLDYTVDRSPYKQGMFLPGTRIPVYSPDQIRRTQPDYLLILPWNLKDEIIQQNAYIRDWGGQFVVPIPEVTVYS
jgi:2-polyprenyl-3-methyl-5-hydroxy-6-metoxy-1,4-benzoquinol methylase